MTNIAEDAPVDNYQRKYGQEKSKTTNNGVLAWGKEIGLEL